MTPRIAERTRARLARLGRRLLLGASLAAVVVGVVTTTLDARVALAGPALAPPPAVPRPPPVASPRPPTRGPVGKLNLNTARADHLEQLPGIGPAKAKAIIEYRGEHGPFRRVVDLRRVKGFGKKTVDRLAPFLTVTEPSSMATTR